MLHFRPVRQNSQVFARFTGHATVLVVRSHALAAKDARLQHHRLLHMLGSQWVRASGRPHQRGLSGAVSANSNQFSESVQQQQTRAHIEEQKLQNFLVWAAKNGVRGLTESESCTALYADKSTAERSVAVLQDIPSGQKILRVPMRLAITDHFSVELLQSLGLTDAPWDVRLSCRLLQEHSKGPSSPWYPYLQVLPDHVPTVSHQEAELSEYSPLSAAVRAGVALAALWHGRLSTAAASGATLEQFTWALSIVHSRTLGTAAAGGGIGTRVLLPAVDMLNHGGDQYAGLRDAPCAAADCARWDLVPPGEHGSDWEMCLSAIRDIEGGEELLICYGERHNDDFLVSYGFCPIGNPHDDVLLFPDLAAALEWYFDRSAIAQGKVLEDEAKELYLAAMSAGLAASDPEATPVPELRLHAGALVDPRLLAAFSVLAPHSAATDIALRCEELLAGCSPLLHDFKALMDSPHLDTQDLAYFERLLSQFQQDVVRLTSATDFAEGRNSQSSHLTWSDRVSRLAGTNSDPVLIKGICETVPLKMLVFRVNKKLIIWDVLLLAEMSIP